MPRTSFERVESVLLADYDCVNGPSLTEFINTASSLVDDVVACVARKNRTRSLTDQIVLSDSKLALMETWLAAHSYAMSDQPYKARSTLRASGQFQGETKMYLEATKYGQQAVLLDPSGCLSDIANGQRPKVRGFWLGKRPSNQTNVEDRT